MPVIRNPQLSLTRDPNGSIKTTVESGPSTPCAALPEASLTHSKELAARLNFQFALPAM